MANKSIMLDVLRLNYGSEYTKAKAIMLKNGNFSDLQLLVNMIDNLVEAVKEFENLNIQNIIIQRAFGKEFSVKTEEITNLIKSLNDRNMLEF